MAEIVWTPRSFVSRVIDPALAGLGLDGPAAIPGVRQLLLGTALQESLLRHLRQLANRDGTRGPALGYFQMEPATHDDIWVNFLAFRPGLATKVLVIAAQAADGATRGLPRSPKAELMAANHPYAAAMARLCYRRAPGRLPAAGDARALAAYWKAHYNTRLGRGLPAEFETKLLAALPDLSDAGFGMQA